MDVGVSGELIVEEGERISACFDCCYCLVVHVGGDLETMMVWLWRTCLVVGGQEA